jgi:hypothetical protein
MRGNVYFIPCAGNFFNRSTGQPAARISCAPAGPLRRKAPVHQPRLQISPNKIFAELSNKDILIKLKKYFIGIRRFSENPVFTYVI